eukprot:g5421.t1
MAMLRSLNVFTAARRHVHRARTFAASPYISPEAEEKQKRRGEPLLFTPGPLTTSAAVKEAMQVDLGSRDSQMLDKTAGIREKLLTMAGTSKEDGFDAVIMQGSGSFAVEAVVSSVVPPPEKGGRLLVLANGAYGERIATMASRAGIDVDIARVGETEAFTAAEAEKYCAGGNYTNVAMVHHETTAGVLNPIREVGEVVRKHLPNASFFVDSMSAFGAYDVDMKRDHVDYLVSSANKNIEGVPGFSFAICNVQLLGRDGVHARTVTLDLLEQLKGLNSNGQFRFTPPTHALLAFDKALEEHEAEGGVPARLARYQRNCDVLLSGMAELGFSAYVPDEHRGCVINTFVFPDDSNFDFTKFYSELARRGMVIYPGKLTGMDCFRIGSIGRLYESDMEDLVSAVRDVLMEMSVKLPVSQLAVE